MHTKQVTLLAATEVFLCLPYAVEWTPFDRRQEPPRGTRNLRVYACDGTPLSQELICLQNKTDVIRVFLYVCVYICVCVCVHVRLCV